MYKGEFQNPAEVHASRNGWTTLELSMVYMRLQEMLWAKSVTSHGGDQHSMFHPTANRLAGFLLEMSVLFKMRLKLFTRNERQMLQWITAPEKAAATTPSSVDHLSAARATYHNLVMKCNVILDLLTSAKWYFLLEGHKFVTKSYDIVHSLSSAKGTSHENALDEAVMQIINYAK
ncbi:hypothetical protein F4604DRAFT_2026027 [Suillus subluteus]|nr:hypothetical protein F4604DRAFT_2026027 [Suillus subluteus]